jgi:hypothetical protein
MLRLRDVPVYVLTIPGNEYKIREWTEFGPVKIHVNEPLEDKMKSIAIGYLNIHTNATVPYLASDDDSVANGYVPEFLTFPDDADIVYLVNSTWRGDSTFTQGEIGCIGYPIGDGEYFRIQNMLGLSACIVCTQQGQEYLKAGLEESISTSIPCDLFWARKQVEYNVYALNIPMFYQSGYNESCTRVNLQDCMKSHYI